MCFSASASFTLAAVLVPVGIASVSAVRNTDPKWLPVAIYPFAFAIQQAAEGLVWTGINTGNEGLVSVSARAFLFFAYLFWLVWVPVSVARVEPSLRRRKILKGLTIAGALFGLTIFLPPFLVSDWLSVRIFDGSLDYQTTLLSDGSIDRLYLRTLYASIIVGAFALSSHGGLQIFGAVIAASLLLVLWAFPVTVISVWCYFAAVISLLVLIIVRRHAGSVAPGAQAPAGVASD